MKEKIKPIICLNRNGTVSSIEAIELKKSIKSDDVKYYLFPVGVEEMQYLVFKPDQILYKISTVDISLVLSATRYEMGYTSIACDGHPKNIHCKDIIEFYNAMHSFSKMSAFNILSNSDNEGDYSDKVFFTISAFNMTVKFSNGKEKSFKFKNKHMFDIASVSTDSAPMLRSLIMEIDDFFEIGDSYNKHRLIPAETMPTLYIDVENSVWQSETDIKKKGKRNTEAFIYHKVIPYDKMDPFRHDYGYIRSFNLNLNDSIAFIPPEDYALLKKYCSNNYVRVGEFNFVTYCEMTHPDTWTYEDRINTEDIYLDTNNFYCHRNVSYHLITISDILEALHMMIYMIQSFKTIESFMNITEDIRQYMVEILLVIKYIKMPPWLAQFRFNITDKEIDDRSDGMYNDFFRELRAFIENNCNEHPYVVFKDCEDDYEDHITN